MYANTESLQVLTNSLLAKQTQRDDHQPQRTVRTFVDGTVIYYEVQSAGPIRNIS
jgi:hypothetical protein